MGKKVDGEIDWTHYDILVKLIRVVDAARSNDMIKGEAQINDSEIKWDANGVTIKTG